MSATFECRSIRWITLSLHPELVEVGSQPSAEGVPAVPREAVPFSAGMIAFRARTLQVER